MSKFLINPIGLLTTISSNEKYWGEPPLPSITNFSSALSSLHSPTKFSFISLIPSQSCAIPVDSTSLTFLSLQGFPLRSHLAPHVPTTTQSHTGNLCHPNRAFSCASCTTTPTHRSLDRKFSFPVHSLCSRSGPHEDNPYVSLIIPSS